MYTKKLKNLYITTIVLSFPFVLFFSSCGSGGNNFSASGSQPLRIEIDLPDEPFEQTQFSSEQVSQTLDERLDTCRIIATGGTPPIDDIIRDFLIDEQKIISIPIRDNIIIMFIGLDMEGNPLCRGEVVVDITFDTESVMITCEFVREICTDGIDNDFDGLIDCQDPECDRVGCSSGNASLECIGGQCVEPEPEPMPEPEPPSQPCPNGFVTGPTGTCLPIVPNPEPIEECIECCEECQG